MAYVFFTKKIFLSLVLCCFLFSCIKNQNNKTVLKNKYCEVNNYSFKREFDKVFNSIKCDTNQVETWRKDFVNNSYFLCDAYEKKYDTIHDINRRLSIVADIMMVQKYGYLWQQTVAPSIDKAMVITDKKKKKRNILFYCEYIMCSDVDTLKTILNNNIEIDISGFNKLKKVSQNYQSLKTGYSSYQWPFITISEYRDIIFSMKENEVSPPLIKGKGLIYLYIDHKETLDANNINAIKFKTELQHIAESKFEKEKLLEIENKCAPILMLSNIDSVYNYIEKGNDIFSYNSATPLIKYSINDTLKQITVNNLIEQLRYSPNAPTIKNREKLISFVNQCFYNSYLISEASELGLYNQNTFIYDKTIFKNKLILNKYMKDEFLSKIHLDSNQIISHYVEKNDSLNISDISVQDIPNNIYNKIYDDIWLNELNQAKAIKLEELKQMYPIIIDKTKIITRTYIQE